MVDYSDPWRGRAGRRDGRSWPRFSCTADEHRAWSARCRRYRGFWPKKKTTKKKWWETSFLTICEPVLSAAFILPSGGRDCLQRPGRCVWTSCWWTSQPGWRPENREVSLSGSETTAEVLLLLVFLVRVETFQGLDPDARLRPAALWSTSEFLSPEWSISEEGEKKTKKNIISQEVWNNNKKKIWRFGNRCSHLVPALHRILPPLHQVAFTDPWDGEVQSGAWSRNHLQMLQVFDHLPVTRLENSKRFGSFIYFFAHQGNTIYKWMSWNSKTNISQD